MSSYTCKEYDNLSIWFESDDVQITIPKANILKASGGGLPGTFLLEHMHWHWWSEHKMEDLRYPLEMHLVHRNTIYENISEAIQHDDGIAVFGILFHITDKPNKPLSDVLQSMNLIEAVVGTSTVLYKDIQIMDFFPKDMSHYFRYKGSLTTPNCEESVMWTVFQETVPVTYEQVEEFMSIRKFDGQFLKTNYRNIQAMFNRAVMYVEPSESAKDKHVNNTASYTYFGISIGVAVLDLLGKIYGIGLFF